jgi:Ala-tRNA(Pro) deacylase
MPIQRLQEFFESNHIPYETLPHALTYTSQGTASLVHVSGREIAKSVVVYLDDAPGDS